MTEDTIRSARPISSSRLVRDVPVAPGRVLKATAVFDTYWQFATRRQNLFMRRVNGAPPPWTDDPVLATYRFTNAYRAADRVSQYLIRNVLYRGVQNGNEIFFRALLFKLFNRIETWEELEGALGLISWETFDFEHYAQILDAIVKRGDPIYSAAYIMPSPSFGSAQKHRNHLRLLEHMMRAGAPLQVERARCIQEIFEILRGYPSLGDFLAFQFAIDLNYSEMINFSEMDFVVAGPGARNGIRKCFVDTAGLAEDDVIRAVTELAEREFERLGLSFPNLWGRPLHLVDCQNLFCEVDKYARVVHPEFQGISKRARIKQRFIAKARPLSQWYPPKWRVAYPTGLTESKISPSRSLSNANQGIFGFSPKAE